jgi:hypothetical protein
MAALVVALSAGRITAQDAATTEDILYMADGRVLHGQIVSEDAGTLVFEYIDRASKIRSKLTIRKETIAEIKRDVPIDSATPAAPGSAPSSSSATAPAASTSSDSSSAAVPTGWGATRMATDREGVKSLYVLPMRGQMGTDIHPSVYEQVKGDIMAVKPDVLVLVLDSKDIRESMIAVGVSPLDVSLPMFDEYRALARLFRVELRDIPQVLWVKDSIGFSTPLALAWGDMYMAPGARLGGMRRVLEGGDSWNDEDVRAKMRAAGAGAAKALAEHGGYSLTLAEGMITPDYSLSASFVGRQMDWKLDETGEVVVDTDEDAAAEFTAKDAEDYLICDGIAENLDDLAFLLGLREYRLVGDSGKEMVESYLRDWHRLYENTVTWYSEFETHMGWAGGAEQLKWLGQAKADLQKIVNAMERYPAIETRWKNVHGTSKPALKIQIEQINETIRALKAGGAGGGGGAGAGGAGAGGGGRRGE